MSALDDAIAAHAAHAAGACADPLTDSLAEQCTRPADLPPGVHLRPGWENEPAEPPIPWRWIWPLAALITAVLGMLGGCGGGGDDDEAPCRPDFVGPPAPGQEGLPICTADGRATIPPALCRSHPERCG